LPPAGLRSPRDPGAEVIRGGRNEIFKKKATT